MRYYRKVVVCILLLLLVHSLYSENSEQKPFLKQISEEFLIGILRANYRETPIDEILPVNQVPIDNIHLPTNKTHPSLLFKPEKINSIRNRRFRLPYSEWADNIIEAALALNYPADSPLLFELTRSKIAKLNAFAFFLTQNENFLNEAICALTNISETKPPDTAEGGKPGVGWGDWMQAAEALQNYAVAYDMIYSEFDEDQIIFIEDRLATKTNQIYKNFTRIPGSMNSTDLAIGFGIPKNNHIIDISCGVATVAMVLDHRNSEKWFKAAITELQSGLAFILPDGSYREGAYYARFIVSRMFPFFFYLYNVTNENLFEHPVINRLNRWLIDLEKPDGTVSDFDDAYPEKLLYQPIAVGLSPSGKELRYLFEKNANRFSRFNANFVETFCAFDDRVKSRKPATGSAVFYPDGGITIYHGNNDIYGLFLGEPGRPYLCNHEHIEPAAFTLSAYGKNFLIDAGYGHEGTDDPNRNWYISAQSHNIPLINGLGPDQNPVWGDDLGSEMLAYFQSDQFSSSTVKAFYRDTEVSRTIWFARQKYFIVIDNLKSKFRNRYSIPWHGLGNIRKIDENHILWEQDDIELQVEFLTPEESWLSLTTKQGLHTLKEFEKIHTTTIVSFPRSTQQKLITLFIPDDKTAPEMKIEKLAILSNGNVTARRIRSITQNIEDILILADSAWTCINIRSDAQIAFIQKENSIRMISIRSATNLFIEDEMIFQSDHPVDLTLNLDDRGWFGYLGLETNDKTQVILYPPTDPGLMILNKKIVKHRWENFSLIVSVSESGIFQTGIISDRIGTTEQVRSDLPVLEQLSASINPAWEMDNLNYYEKTQLRNEIIYLVGTDILQYSDSLLGRTNLIPSVYGIASGLHRYIWNSSDDYSFTLPQRFRLEREISGYKFNYYEEGFLYEKGIKPAIQKFAIDNFFFFSHERDFEDHNFTEIEFNYSKYFLRTFFEKFQDDYGYQLELRKDFETGWLGLHHSQNDFYNELSNAFAFAHREWAGNFTVNRFQRQYEYYISGKRIGKRTSFSWIGSANNEKEITEIGISNSIYLSRHFIFSSNFGKLQIDETDFSDLNFFTSLYYSCNKLNGSLSVNRNEEDNITANYNGIYRFGKWRLSDRTTFDNVFKGDFGVSYRSKKYSWQYNISHEKECLFNLIFHPSFLWTPLFNIEWDMPVKEVNTLNIGLYYNGVHRLGSEFSIMCEEDCNLFGLIGVFDVSLSEVESVQVYSTAIFSENGNINSYELNLTQTGKNITPGVSISRNERGFERFEGYLKWVF
jgi:hypothetical protein